MRDARRLAAGTGQLSPGLDPRHWLQTGAGVLDHGLPGLPGQLTHEMSVPLCCWAAGRCAAVAFLQFHRDPDDGRVQAMAATVPYTRQDGRWVPPQGSISYWWSFKFDPVSDPGRDLSLDGRAMTYGNVREPESRQAGQPGSITFGSASPDVKYLAVIQDGRLDRRPLQSHFGTWIVCLEQPGTFDVAAFDTHGSLLACLEHPFPLTRHLRRSANS